MDFVLWLLGITSNSLCFLQGAGFGLSGDVRGHLQPNLKLEYF